MFSQESYRQYTDYRTAHKSDNYKTNCRGTAVTTCTENNQANVTTIAITKYTLGGIECKEQDNESHRSQSSEDIVTLLVFRRLLF